MGSRELSEVRVSAEDSITTAASVVQPRVGLEVQEGTN
jgi:hypothetical protein